MDKNIKINHTKNFIILNNKLEPYDLNTGRLWKYFNIKKLLSDDEYLKFVYISRYDSYEKKYISDYDELFIRKEKKFYIPLSKNFIEFYKLNWDEEGYSKEFIILCNTHLTNNVDSFYEFSLEVEIEGIRFKDISDFGEDIDLSTPNNNEELKEKMILMFGKPKVHPQNEGDKYGQFMKNHFFVSKSRINKIVGIQSFRDTSTLGQEDGEQFDGKKTEIVLDLNNFDRNIYEIFKEHGMLVIEDF